jgi:L-fuconolactonase
MPEFPIIDAHVHLYDPAALSFPWMAGEPQLNSPHGLKEFSAASSGVAVESIVFVEVDVAPGQHLEEVRWVERHGASDPRLSGIVGSMPLEKGAAAVASDLESFAALPHARGVRRLIQDRPAGWALQPAFVEGVRLLARFGLPFDLCIRHGQMTEALDLVRLCPEVRFVLDHIGKPGIRERRLEPWRMQIQALAREPNVWCKISGVATEADHRGWRFEDVEPYVARALECFGFDRAMFGGDWPVSTLATDYVGWVDVVDRIVAGATRDERLALYRATATSFYGLAPD